MEARRGYDVHYYMNFGLLDTTGSHGLHHLCASFPGSRRGKAPVSMSRVSQTFPDRFKPPTFTIRN